MEWMSQSSFRYFLVGTTLNTGPKLGRRLGRPNYPLEFKKQLAQAACDPNVSVSRLTREHGINANMLFKWRRHLRAGLFGESDAHPALLPVTIIGSSSVAQTAPPHAGAVLTSAAPVGEVAAKPGGVIEIRIRDIVMRIEGYADADTVRAILQELHP
jgi:transposase